MPDPTFDSRLAPEIGDFDAVIRGAVLDAGGFELVMRAETDRAVRVREVEPLLGALGILEIDPAEGEEQLQAAAVAARAAGLYALPYPVAERLAGNAVAGTGVAGSAPVALVVADAGRTGRVRVNHGDLPFDWRAVDAATGLAVAVRSAGGTGGRLGPFVCDAAPGEPVAAPSTALPLALLLPSFTLLGMLESALDLTRDHVNDRVQFGTPIVNFQAVQHQLADAFIAVELFEQQVHYALWSLARRRAGVLVDVVGARLAGLRSASTVLRVGHQLHGATGFADESAISWLSRHSQPLRRLPLDPARTESWFTELVLRHGFDGLFPAAAATAPPSGADDTTDGSPDRSTAGGAGGPAGNGHRAGSDLRPAAPAPGPA